jgi:hypothetical protein
MITTAATTRSVGNDTDTLEIAHQHDDATSAYETLTTADFARYHRADITTAKNTGNGNGDRKCEQSLCSPPTPTSDLHESVVYSAHARISTNKRTSTDEQGADRHCWPRGLESDAKTPAVRTPDSETELLAQDGNCEWTPDEETADLFEARRHPNCDLVWGWRAEASSEPPAHDSRSDAHEELRSKPQSHMVYARLRKAKDSEPIQVNHFTCLGFQVGIPIVHCRESARRQTIRAGVDQSNDDTHSSK